MAVKITMSTVRNNVGFEFLRPEGTPRHTTHTTSKMFSIKGNDTYTINTHTQSNTRAEGIPVMSYL